MRIGRIIAINIQCIVPGLGPCNSRLHLTLFRLFPCRFLFMTGPWVEIQTIIQFFQCPFRKFSDSCQVFASNQNDNVIGIDNNLLVLFNWLSEGTRLGVGQPKWVFDNSAFQHFIYPTHKESGTLFSMSGSWIDIIFTLYRGTQPRWILLLSTDNRFMLAYWLLLTNMGLRWSLIYKSIRLGRRETKTCPLEYSFEGYAVSTPPLT